MGDDANLDLNNSKKKVVRSTGQPTSCQLKSACSRCNKRRITMYYKEHRYLKEQTPLKCSHGIDISSLGPVVSSATARDGTDGVCKEDGE